MFPRHPLYAKIIDDDVCIYTYPASKHATSAVGHYIIANSTVYPVFVLWVHRVWPLNPGYRCKRTHNKMRITCVTFYFKVDDS